jgi:hypothetical protein
MACWSPQVERLLEQDRVVEALHQDLGVSRGRPTAALLIFRCDDRRAVAGTAPALAHETTGILPTSCFRCCQQWGSLTAEQEAPELARIAAALAARMQEAPGQQAIK